MWYSKSTMNCTAVKEKLFNIQKELEMLKRVFFKEPDFDIDEKNWRTVANQIKKTRRGVYQSSYGKK